MIQAIALLKTAIILLTLVASLPNVPQDLRDQAVSIGNQAIAAANVAILEQSVEPIIVAAPTPTPAPVIITSQPTITMPEAPISKAHIDIISPISGKGLGRQYASSTNGTMTDANTLVIGAIVYDDAGDPTNQPTVEVKAKDASQNKTFIGTGVVTPRYVDGSKRVLPVYMFSYDFHTSGDHTITFSTGALTQSVTVTVQ